MLGSSSSDATGDIQKKNQGSLDYFIWKMDESGKQEWQNSFGGNGTDFPYAAKPTADGGYILAGALILPNLETKNPKTKVLKIFGLLKLMRTGKLNGNRLLVEMEMIFLLIFLQQKMEVI